MPSELPPRDQPQVSVHFLRDSEIVANGTSVRIHPTPPTDEYPEPKAPETDKAQSRRSGRIARLALVAIAAVVLSFAGLRAWSYLQSYESTDDAQIDGHIVPISSRVAGTIARVYVQDTDSVATGALIAEIDSRDSQTAVDSARANLEQARAQVEGSRAEAASAAARVAQAQASAAQARKDADRYTALNEQHVVSAVEFDEKLRAATVGEAAADAERAGANAARKNIASRQSAVSAAQAALDQALLNLSYTRITAPATGVVGKKSVEVGQRVEPGEQLLAIVPLDDIWITANFKETQLRRIRPGQRATVFVDSSGREYDGHVEGLGGASGERYSLIPPENATGNYVKIVQRLPVRIRLEAGQDPGHRLRVGMSAQPTVWIK
jgi:membrane fusion protein (multidrug efflux system)